MPEGTHYLDVVGQLLKELEQEGYEGILIGGMALVLLGSRRVTKDFDFLLPESARDQEKLVSIFYKKGFELASKLNDYGDIVRTIDNQKVASLRLQSDKPLSAYFINPQTGLRVDLLFDFPLKLEEVRKKARRKKIRSWSFLVADREALMKLKKIAIKNRSQASDLQDLEFLKKI